MPLFLGIRRILPIILTPGIALLILSTVTISVALTRGISELIERNGSKAIVLSKMRQLGVLNRALILLYGSVALLTISGISTAGFGLPRGVELNRFFTLAGILMLFAAMLLLVLYAIRSLRIRRARLHEKLQK